MIGAALLVFCISCILCLSASSIFFFSSACLSLSPTIESSFLPFLASNANGCLCKAEDGGNSCDCSHSCLLTCAA